MSGPVPVPTPRRRLDGRFVEELAAIATTHGLDALGVCAAVPFTTTHHELRRRIALGLADDMAFTYRRPHVASDPTRSLPDATSLVVGAVGYGQTAPPRPPGAWGRVARYAWSAHYERLGAGLAAVAARLAADGWRTRVLVDDNALVDREAAHRAGLGWYGKNANLLLPGRGSEYVLGSVLTDAPLPVAAEPVGDGCGPCRRCLDACPTGAIVAPGVIDARHCLAWLVQKTGTFPRAHRVALGDRIYGCDDCQDVCPVNRRAEHAGAGPAGPLPPPEAWVALVDLLDADDATLLERHGRWYVPARDPAYLRRNALVALGNVGDQRDPDVLRVLGDHLAHPAPLVRAHAVWAAARLGRSDLVALVADDPAEEVRAEIARIDDVPVRTATRRAPGEGGAGGGSARW